MKWRLTISMLILIFVILFGFTYEKFKGPVEGELAVKQIEDSHVDYVIGKEGARGIIQTIVYGGSGIFLLVVWLPLIIRRKKSESNTN